MKIFKKLFIAFLLLSIYISPSPELKPEPNAITDKGLNVNEENIRTKFNEIALECESKEQDGKNNNKNLSALNNYMSIAHKENNTFNVKLQSHVNSSSIDIKDLNFEYDKDLFVFLRDNYVCPFLSAVKDEIEYGDIKNYIEEQFPRIIRKEGEVKGQNYKETITVEAAKEDKVQLKLVIEYHIDLVDSKYEVTLDSDYYSNSFIIELPSKVFIDNQLKKSFDDVYKHTLRRMKLDIPNSPETKWVIGSENVYLAMKKINNEYNILKEDLDSIISKSNPDELEESNNILLNNDKKIKITCTNNFDMDKMVVKASYTYEAFDPENKQERKIALTSVFPFESLFNLNMVIESFIDDFFFRVSLTDPETFQPKFKKR